MKVAQELIGEKSYGIKETAAYACRRIKTLIEKFGPRAPGSPSEYAAQKSMAKEMKPWTDQVDIEEFTVHRQAFMGFIPFTIAMGVASVFLFWFNLPWLGTILAVLGGIPLVLEFAMYREFIDKLFPGHTSHNVIGVRKAQGETKKRIIFIGHADSQYEWTLNYKLGGNGMKAILIPAVVGFIITLIANIVKMICFNFLHVDITTGFWSIFFLVVGIVLFVFLPFFLAFLLFQNPFRSVPGANDNLSGCYVAIGIVKSLAEADIRFKDTEVIAMLSGSEEAGLRGAKAYVKAHKDELLDDDIETIAIAVDTFRDLDDMAVYDRDMSGTVRHDMGVKELVKEAGAHCGFDLSYESVYIGATDAAAFTQGGIKATGFAAMDPTPPRYYHTRLDNWDMLVPEAIQAGIEIGLEATCMYAEEGLQK